MATKKTYKFPKGTEKISAKQMKEALCNYEVVEIPGSVLNVKIEPGDYADEVKTKKVVFREGVQTLRLCPGCEISYNIPKSVSEVLGGWNADKYFQAPKVLCLPSTVIQTGMLSGVEYLQAYSTSYIGYSKCDNLKHYVILGEKVQMKSGSYVVPDGCVIHVESKKMAASLIKKVNPNTVYVINDAKEWKDFPADKLALTMEEYDPESRILPEQIKMREELRQIKQLKEQKRQEEERERQKRRMLSTMTTSYIAPVLEPLGLEYKVRTEKYEPTGCLQCHLKVRLVTDLFPDGSTKNLLCLVVMDVEDVSDRIAIAAEQMQKIRELHESHQDLFSQRKIYYKIEGQTGWAMINSTPRIALSIPGGELRAALSEDNMLEDVRKLKDFADKLNSLMKEAMDALEVANISLEVGRYL